MQDSHASIHPIHQKKNGHKSRGRKVLPRFELGLPDSISEILDLPLHTKVKVSFTSLLKPAEKKERVCQFEALLDISTPLHSDDLYTTGPEKNQIDQNVTKMALGLAKAKSACI